ncbi:hypothetical protein D3C76_910670 [compost metagenome]
MSVTISAFTGNHFTIFILDSVVGSSSSCSISITACRPYMLAELHLNHMVITIYICCYIYNFWASCIKYWSHFYFTISRVATVVSRAFNNNCILRSTQSICSCEFNCNFVARFIKRYSASFGRNTIVYFSYRFQWLIEFNFYFKQITCSCSNDRWSFFIFCY